MKRIEGKSILHSFLSGGLSESTRASVESTREQSSRLEVRRVDPGEERPKNHVSVWTVRVDSNYSRVDSEHRRVDSRYSGVDSRSCQLNWKLFRRARVDSGSRKMYGRFSFGVFGGVSTAMII